MACVAQTLPELESHDFLAGKHARAADDAYFHR
jgi:hypothetical protein